MYDGKEEKLVLIKEVASTHALQVVDQADTKLFKQKVMSMQRQRHLNQQANQLVDEALQSMEGEVVSDMLDFLSKELIRLQEERRVHAFSMIAERQRRMREAEESGLRQVEERRRREEDEIFKQVKNFKIYSFFNKKIFNKKFLFSSSYSKHNKIVLILI
jgi:hypothetical protein